MNTALTIMLTILFLPAIVGLIVSICIQRWSIHSLNIWEGEK